MAVINDFQADLKAIMKQQGFTQTDLAERLDTKQQDISKALSREQFNKNFIRIAETLGYDIKVVYVRNDQVIKK